MQPIHTVCLPRPSIRRAATLLVAAFVAMAATMNALAQDDDALPFAKPGENSATIVGAVGRPAQYIYPVDFIAIDGRNIHPREAIWLEPGEYELTVRAFITNPPGLRSNMRSRGSEGYNRITVVVEAGKEYSIGMKYDRAKPAGSPKAVLYRVKEN
ncbi:MAG TPA: hypothetical protein VKO85_09595 [Wenzhouxiangellaceae bacterium]|nr:hypothetical protein [Wenzhouxiangellaceae bacterium]